MNEVKRRLFHARELRAQLSWAADQGFSISIATFGPKSLFQPRRENAEKVRRETAFYVYDTITRDIRPNNGWKFAVIDKP